jgi:hypothetical protein
MVSLHLKDICTLVCLNEFLICLTGGDVYVNLVHLVSGPEVVGMLVGLIFAAFCVLVWLLGF